MRVLLREKNTRTIQFSYKKWGTHARVFSQHFRLGTGRMIQEKDTEEEGKRRVNMENKAGTKKTSPRPNCASGLPSFGIATPRSSG